MSTWAGWQRQFLNRSNILLTPPGLRFLTAWANHAATDCGNNPNDLSHKLPGSTDCAALHGIFAQAQRYTSHGQAATAFRDELNQPFARALLHALQSGNPYQVHAPSDVASVLVSWGSDEYADVYLNVVQGRGGGGGGGSAGVHKGWADLQRTLGKHRLGKKIVATNRMDAATLRALRRAHKVRLR